jgi:SAM-dependent methyltransferase
MSAQLQANVEYLSETRKTHARAYEGGYGVLYPESHIIRCYEQVLRSELGLDGSKHEPMLDFGCGTGTHCWYFQTKGFQAYGVDSDRVAIRQSKLRFPDIADHFAVVPPQPNADRTYFHGMFDLILSNQVLYYLSNRHLKLCLDGLHRQLKPGGVLVASMMTTRHYLHRNSRPAEDGLRRAQTTGPNGPQVYYIGFVASKDEVRERFAMFEPLHIGHYDFSIRESEGSREHYLFVGRKAE